MEILMLFNLFPNLKLFGKKVLKKEEVKLILNIEEI
jgi:hypothetical protein